MSENNGYAIDMEEVESPYCSICTGCGEDGCCSAMVCEFHPQGKYCDSYLRELRFGYECYKELLKIVVLTPEQDEEFTKKWNEAYDTIFK